MADPIPTASARPARPADPPRPSSPSPRPLDPYLIRANARLPILRARRSPQNPGGPFADLPYLQQQAAQQWFYKFCQRWEAKGPGQLPSWRRAILAGVARRLALHPPAANFARSLHAHLGANRLAQQCRDEGRSHPRIVAMQAAKAWKRAGRPGLPTRQLPI